MKPRPPAPPSRVRLVGEDRPVRDAGYVLYWQIAHRRTRANFALDHALHYATTLRKPLVVLEPLRCGYQWASDRLHRFVLDGIRDHSARYAKAGIAHYVYVEPENGAGKGLLESMASDACVVVTDDFPAFFLPRMVATAGSSIDTRLEAVDSNGLIPIRAPQTTFSRAFDFRRWLQKHLLEHLDEAPILDPLLRLTLPDPPNLSQSILERWPRADESLLSATGTASGLDSLPIDHNVPVVELEGGEVAGRSQLSAFIRDTLPAYNENRNHPDQCAASGLSPYLHFGHVSPHEVFHELATAERWSPDRITAKPAGQRAGFWGMSESGESFLDEFLTWRELGLNMCVRHPENFDQYESLPSWAQNTLHQHAVDERPYLYTHEELESAETHDEVWNAAQRELRATGRMHNYLRMLWGKKILEWSPTPQHALSSLIQLNNRWALDGRDPNSYSGIFWVLGRYDRAWGPERPVYGKIRYMTSDSTKRKLRMKTYLARWSQAEVRTQHELF